MKGWASAVDNTAEEVERLIWNHRFRNTHWMIIQNANVKLSTEMQIDSSHYEVISKSITIDI